MISAVRKGWVQSGAMVLRARLKDFSAAVKFVVALDGREFVGRLKGFSAAVTALCGGKPRAHKTILKMNGEKTQNEIKEKKGGRSTRQRSFRAQSLNFYHHRSEQGGTHERCPELDLSLEAIGLSIAKCRRHKATGRDLLSNEVMQVGGRPMAELTSGQAIKIADTERWPEESQGGRATELFKKGSPL